MSKTKQREKKEKRPFQLGLYTASVLFVISVLMNFVLPLKLGDMPGIRIWSVIDCVIWIYGFLNALGYVKQIESKDEDGHIVYKTSIPLVQIALLRVAQVLYYYWRFRGTINVITFTIIIALDVLITIFLLIDKSTYVFESYVED